MVLTLCGGLGWALGNLASRKAAADSPLRLTLWMSVVPPIPMLALSFALDGPAAITTSLSTLGTPTALLAVGGLAYTVVVATLLGSGTWTTLMARHPSSTVAPFSMLVPVVGFASSWLLLHEQPSALELALGGLVVGGVLVGSTRPRTADGPGPGRRDRVGLRPRDRRSADDQRRRDRRDALAPAGQA
ncbi:EamA family transporter [Cellulomonas sp. KRMCY2]|uniref:EamA family transporter n=1 Tax=Cellulomonas sp. KRMCY2 TaxID=1304865 RepID=UPI0004B3225C|nr:EamA family transporter [Cellulomonas sp. KRMCY2]